MATLIPEPPRGITFEDVWASLMTLREENEKRAVENEKRALENEKRAVENEKRTLENEKQKKEAEKQMRELREQMKETDRRLHKSLGELGGRFGEMTEHLVMPNLLSKFRKLGFGFTKAYFDAVIKDANYNFIAEVDITLENGEDVMLVEVKTKPSTTDISEHVERIEKLCAYADSRNDKRKYMGAIAGMIIKENEKKYAFKNGLYVIVPSGETFDILVPDSPYSPREW